MTPTNEHASKRALSNGEKTFDLLTYGGLAGVGTFALTVPVTDWLTHEGRGGFKAYSAAAKWVEHTGLKSLPKASRKGVAEGLVKTTALMMGGNLMLVPIWGAEQMHTPIVNGINKFTNDPTPEQAIAEKPKQTARSLIEGRLTAFAAVFAGLYTAGKFFEPQMTAFENATGRAAAGFMNKAPNDTSKSFRYGKIGAWDLFATVTAAGLLYVASRFFAKNKQEKEQPPQTFATAEVTAQSAPTMEASPKEAAQSTNTSQPNASIAHVNYDGRTVAPQAMAAAQA